ncbi:reverse transcriptase domain-containing protein [Terasakiella sp.]|uniref:reverse transcriptase domain-containing protein n=1 Tax=Terasakiella sp. TaxID=2034861 RepID=UPI003AA9E0CA
MSNHRVPKEISNARREANKILRRIKAARMNGKKEQARRLTWRYLNSFYAKLVAQYDAYKPKNRPGLQKIIEQAELINMWAKCNEPVRVKGLTKKDGRVRKICAFSPRNKARQILIKNLLEASGEISPFVYDAKDGGGVNGAAEKIKTLMEEGATHFVVADIKDCFNSFSAGELYDVLPLPRKVIDTTLVTDDLNLVGKRNTTPIRVGIRRRLNNNISSLPPRFRPTGLPQGSVASNLVATWLIAERLKAMPHPERIVLFRDDMVIAARGEEDAHAIVCLLERSFTENPVGRLEFKTLEVCSVCGDGVYFLGYNIYKHRSHVNILPSLSSIQKMYHKSVWAMAKDLRERNAAPIRLETYLNGWANAFRLSWYAEREAQYRFSKLSKVFAAAQHN